MSTISSVTSSPTPVQMSQTTAASASPATNPAAGAGASNPASGDQVSLSSTSSSSLSVQQNDNAFMQVGPGMGAKEFVEMAIALLLLKALEGDDSKDGGGSDTLKAVIGLAALGAAFGGQGGDALMSSSSSVQSSAQTYNEQGNLSGNTAGDPSQQGNMLDVTV